MTEMFLFRILIKLPFDYNVFVDIRSISYLLTEMFLCRLKIKLPFDWKCFCRHIKIKLPFDWNVMVDLKV
jgi:hypothetical protein